MNAMELKNDGIIKEYTYNELMEIEKITNKPVDIRIVDKLKADGLTKMARANMEKTIIFIKESCRPYINHLLLHECGHIRRTFSVPSKDRVSLSHSTDITGTKMFINCKKELMTKKNIPVELIDDFCTELIYGVTLQIFNIIPDIRIERRIYEEYPENREEEKAYLLYLSKTFESCLGEQLLSLMPQAITEISLGANYLFLDSLKSITGSKTLNLYKSNSIAKKGYAKIKEAFIPVDKGYLQDIRLTNKILDIFNVNFVKWIDFNKTYFGYELDY